MNLDKEKITAILMLEILGRPPEHLKKTLENIIEKMSQEKGVKIISKRIHEAVPLKERKDFFTSFAEIEVEVDGILYLAMLMFKYMPAHIDILSPENIILKNNEISEVMNELTRRLHGYDEVARVIQAEKKILETKMKNMLEEEKKTEKKEEKKKD